jgi:alpha-1,2-mannosyltransferase
MIISGSDRIGLFDSHKASQRWLVGAPLYDGSGVGGFVYFPQAAVLLIPLAFVPSMPSEILWRIVSIAVFALGLYRFVQPADKDRRDLYFLIATLISVPMAWDCVRNGQATVLMAGLMLLSLDYLVRSRWWMAAALLTLSVAVKPLSLVLCLLILALYRPMMWRMIVSLAAFLLIPFLMQRPEYVMQQYLACYANMTNAAHVSVVSTGWTTPFSTLRFFGVSVPETTQHLIQFLAAPATLGLCYLAARWSEPRRTSIYLYSFAALYLMLFSPRTENNTYMMLGPVIAVFMTEELFDRRNRSSALLLGSVAFFIISHTPVARLFSRTGDTTWFPPIMAAVLGCYLLVRLFSWRETLAERPYETESR